MASTSCGTTATSSGVWFADLAPRSVCESITIRQHGRSSQPGAPMSAHAPHAPTPGSSNVSGPLLPVIVVLLFAMMVTPPLRAQGAAESTRTRLGPAFGLHVGAPQKVSLALGVGRWRGSAGENLDGVFGLVEPGLGGGGAR